MKECLIRGDGPNSVNHGEIITTIGDLTITRIQEAQNWAHDQYRVVAPDMSSMSVREMIDIAPWDGCHDHTVLYDLDSAVAFARECVAKRQARRQARAKVLAERAMVWPEPRPCRISKRRLARIHAGTKGHAAVCAEASDILGVPVRMATAYTAMGYYPSAIATVDGVDVPLMLDGDVAAVADDDVTSIR